MKKSLHSHSPLHVQVRIQHSYCPCLQVPLGESWGNLKVQIPTWLPSMWAPLCFAILRVNPEEAQVSSPCWKTVQISS